ncbi:MAG: GNAT family N-acetyltransferase [Bosea sp. (in: a-proteobacteria)]|uniref:GNAT family N-acetyltransferase n=1 Tax=Bosea sp. (in: a-proteobacteria) TaxID=1871050 RepID=UPI0027339422|nr:GNAT family N-acetyltransferase [Bosea sp. (in: a-proteobacteria)]MDP3257998.1 GNAT family N-acetyltransferase [Bosea sp. (in: a-proteobacteria)]MDP3320062.1 GNAT family N-acetyltransferase [Bosea sp. (in: a-proteobacteria)]
MTDAVPELDLVLACERRIVNAWPSPATLLIDDWVVRFAGGYSGRANAASALRPGAELDEDTLSLIEELFRSDGLPPCIRLTPLVAETTRAMVAARGYVVRDASFGLIRPLDDVTTEIEPDLQIEARPSAEWIAGVAARQTGIKADAGKLTAIVEGVRLPAAFATWLIGGEPVAFGMSVAERGMAEIGSVVVDTAHRGQGLGRRLIAGLMGWARAKDCRQAYLQVDQTNAVANGLYGSLGFRQLYAYETRVLDLAG